MEYQVNDRRFYELSLEEEITWYKNKNKLQFIIHWTILKKVLCYRYTDSLTFKVGSDMVLMGHVCKYNMVFAYFHMVINLIFR